jgi:PIN domain nuclease of toxin-antitoxin system
VRILIDTHAFLWAASDDRRLSPAARAILASPDNEVLFSAASAAEISIKAARGRLELPDMAEPYVASRVAIFGFAPLPIDARHALRSGQLPPIHWDPWDRLLVAQAQLEGVPLLTSDHTIARYDIETTW